MKFTHSYNDTTGIFHSLTSLLPPGGKTSHLYAYIHIHERATVIQD